MALQYAHASLTKRLAKLRLQAASRHHDVSSPFHYRFGRTHDPKIGGFARGLHQLIAESGRPGGERATETTPMASETDFSSPRGCLTTHAPAIAHTHQR